MNTWFIRACLAAGLLAAFTTSATADVKDSWISTKAKIALLTNDGFSVKGAGVDSVNGNVTLHGKVNTEADRSKAEVTVRQLEGVKTVKNLIQVVPEAEMKAVGASDSDVKDRVQASLRKDSRLEDIKVASVDNGLVLLSGKAHGIDEKLAAIEAAYAVTGVRRVATVIETVVE